MKGLVALLLLLLGALPARAETLVVLTTGAYRGVLADLAPQVEAATGHRLEIRNDTAGVVAGRIRNNEVFDLVVISPAAAETLGARVGPITPLARVGVGVAVRAGAPMPDIGTPEAVRAAVLAARAPAWIDPASGGTSGIYLSRLFEQWGIAASLAPKAVLVQGGLVADKLAAGVADLGFQQISELMHGEGVTVVGLLPPSIQLWTVYAGTVPANSPHPAAAASVMAWLAGPQAAAALAGHGMLAP